MCSLKQVFLALLAMSSAAYSAPPAQADPFPARIHVFEDYETDIEKRWWLRGKLETSNLLPGSARACRGVPSNDFDDKMGDKSASYTAVVFNPVPGPPMGSRTRLRFRYFLKGSPTLRVQIYSLTNNYHRRLMLSDLPQGQWKLATVDMTLARRPDGSGGPLSADERIDDIQFYTDPKAELIIDDIVLYDAPETASTEKREPFPTRILFTGWFDTGRQGQEWPGTFDIIPHVKPLSWKCAASVANPQTQSPWLRIHLRGQRSLAADTALRFRYHLTGANQLRASLVNSATGRSWSRELKELSTDRWSDLKTQFSVPAQSSADELHLILPAGAQLLADDLLLFEPGP